MAGQLVPAELSRPEPVLLVGATVMLRSSATHGCLSVSVDQTLAGETPRTLVTCGHGGPSSRTAIQLLSYHAAQPSGQPITYGSRVVFVFSHCGRALGSACPSMATLGSQLTGKQDVYAADASQSGDFAWEIVPADFALRLPMNGSPVDSAAPFVLIHCMTGSRLGSTAEPVSSEFGLEAGVCAHTFKESAGRMHRCVKEAGGFPYMPQGARREVSENLWSAVFSGSD
jgi:hypothetical protein